MNNQEVMNEDDIHDFGINVVAEYSQKDGFEIVSINKDRKYNPQIVAKKNGQLAFIIVDWDTVNELARQAFQSIAPRKLAALIEQS